MTDVGGEGRFGPRPPKASETVGPTYETDTPGVNPIHAKGFINHGDDADAERPPGFASVEWFGTVEPNNAVDGDTIVIHT